jgi:hypothetical protein
MLSWAWNGSNDWHAETAAGPGTTYSAPSMIAAGSGFVIAAEGADNKLVVYGALAGSGYWSTTTVAGDLTTYSAPAVISTAGHTEVSPWARTTAC